MSVARNYVDADRAQLTERAGEVLANHIRYRALQRLKFVQEQTKSSPIVTLIVCSIA